MIDTVNLRLPKEMAQGVNFMEEIPCYVSDVSEHHYEDGTVIMGKIKGLKVTITDQQVKLNEGSLCKWYLGDNYQVMGRGDTQGAIEELSDTLHLPMEKARVTRLDIACNIITNYPVSVYFNHLGELKHTNRLSQPNGILYKGSNQCVCIYDKNKEQQDQDNEELIPELYRDRNVLRIEVRCLKRLSKQFHVEAVTAAMLYDEAFYIQMVDWWYSKYQSIEKINDIMPNFTDMKTKHELYMMCLRAKVQDFGGEMAFIQQLKEAQQRGELTAKQAHDLKMAVKTACNSASDCVVKSDAITELDKRVKEAIKYYR